MSEELESGTLLGYVGCPEHGGSDSVALYEKNDYVDGYCWAVCGKFDPKELKEMSITDGAKEVLVDFVQSANSSRKGGSFVMTDDIRDQLEKIQKEHPIRGWRERRIKKITCDKYKVHTKMDSDDNVVLRYYPSTEVGELTGYHVRNDPVKQARKKDKSIKALPFFPIGNVSIGCELFGQSLFTKGGRYVVLTEGEEDAMAVYQALRNEKYETPVVSPTVGSRGAVSQIKTKRNYDFLKSFDKIILMVDKDEAGDEFAKKVTQLFGTSKVCVAELPVKDPCEALLKDNGHGILRNAFWQAMPKKPSQVLTVDDIFEKAMKMPEMGLSLPWESATGATLGVRRGEIHIVGAAPKIGKTEHQHQLIKHFTDVHREKIGVMSLEENPVKTLKKIAGKYSHKQFTKPPEVAGYTMEEMHEAFTNLRGKMEFYSSDGVRDYEEILETFRYWHAEGIWLFIVDPLTALVAEYSSSEANDILNKFMSKASSMCMELGITIFMYSHVNPVKSGVPHDQGGDVLSSQFTGSRAMEKWAHYGWGIQRNRTEKDPIKRNTARVTMLFDREFGEYCEYFAFYDSVNNDWYEVKVDESEFDDLPYFESDHATVDVDDELIKIANNFEEVVKEGSE